MIVAGGSFTSFTPNAATTATARNYLARIKTDGTLDTFDPSASGAVSALAAYFDGKIIVGGAFNAFSPNSIGNTNFRNYIARLNADGTVDSNFDPNTNGPVNAVAVESNGAVVFGGTFTALKPTAPSKRSRGTVSPASISPARSTPPSIPMPTAPWKSSPCAPTAA